MSLTGGGCVFMLCRRYRQCSYMFWAWVKKRPIQPEIVERLILNSFARARIDLPFTILSHIQYPITEARWVRKGMINHGSMLWVFPHDLQRVRWMNKRLAYSPTTT